MQSKKKSYLSFNTIFNVQNLLHKNNPSVANKEITPNYTGDPVLFILTCSSSNSVLVNCRQIDIGQQFV